LANEPERIDLIDRPQAWRMAVCFAEAAPMPSRGVKSSKFAVNVETFWRAVFHAFIDARTRSVVRSTPPRRLALPCPHRLCCGPARSRDPRRRESINYPAPYRASGGVWSNFQITRGLGVPSQKYSTAVRRPRAPEFPAQSPTARRQPARAQL